MAVDLGQLSQREDVVYQVLRTATMGDLAAVASEVITALHLAGHLADGEAIAKADIDYEAALNEYLYLGWAARGYGPYAEELADRVLDNGVTVPVISNFEEARRIVDAALHLPGDTK